MAHENLTTIQGQDRANNQRNRSRTQTAQLLFFLFCAVVLTIGGQCNGGGFMIATSAVPDATECQSYTATVMVTGLPGDQSGPLQVVVSSGMLPPGINLAGTASGATLSGTPTTPGTYNFTISAVVQAGSGTLTTRKSFTIVVSPGPCGMPVLTSLNSNNAVAGSGNLSVTITGMNFVAGATVNFGTVTLTPSSISPTQIVVTIPGSALNTPGTVPVTVTDSGGTSNSLTFTITNPAPTVSSLAPNTAIAGSPSFMQTITGTGFGTFSTVIFGNRTLPPATVSPTQLTVFIPEDAGLTAGTVQESVINSGPGGGQSTPVVFLFTDTFKSYTGGLFFTSGDSAAEDVTTGIALTTGDAFPSVFVEDFSQGTWSQRSQLGAAQSGAVSGDGNTALTCGPSAGPTGSGSAGVYTVQNQNWPTGPLTGISLVPSGSTNPGPLYGQACDLSGDGNNAVVSDPGNGVVYLFKFGSNGTWSQAAKITDSTVGSSAGFGSSISTDFHARTLAVGVPGTLTGQVDVFNQPSNGWADIFAPSFFLQGLGAANGDQEGFSVKVSADGNVLVSGSPGANGGAGTCSLFTKGTSGWTQAAQLKPNVAQSSDAFCKSVWLSSDGSTTVAGAPNANSGQGQAYIFQAPYSGTQNENQILTPSGGITINGGTAAFTNNFGIHISVSDDGTTILVGGTGFDAQGTNQKLVQIWQ